MSSGRLDRDWRLEARFMKGDSVEYYRLQIWVLRVFWDAVWTVTSKLIMIQDEPFPIDFLLKSCKNWPKWFQHRLFWQIERLAASWDQAHCWTDTPTTTFADPEASRTSLTPLSVRSRTEPRWPVTPTRAGSQLKFLDGILTARTTSSTSSHWLRHTRRSGQVKRSTAKEKSVSFSNKYCPIQWPPVFKIHRYRVCFILGLSSTFKQVVWMGLACFGQFFLWLLKNEAHFKTRPVAQWLRFSLQEIVNWKGTPIPTGYRPIWLVLPVVSEVRLRKLLSAEPSEAREVPKGGWSGVGASPSKKHHSCFKNAKQAEKRDEALSLNSRSLFKSYKAMCRGKKLRCSSTSYKHWFIVWMTLKDMR